MTLAVLLAVFRIGIIGCDTSHTEAFAKIANVDRDPRVAGFRVTCAYKWGSADIVSPTNRYPAIIAELNGDSPGLAREFAAVKRRYYA